MGNDQQPFVTIVSGLPRSGTTMMMQMLAAGGMPVLTDRVRSADEDNRKGYYELEAVKRTKHDASWLQHAPAKAVKVVYMLLYDLPEDYSYRVLLMKRNLEEVLASQQTMLARRGEQGAELAPQKMAEVFAGQLDKLDRWLAGQTNFRVLPVDYQRVIADPLTAAQRVDEFLGNRLDVSAMALVVDPLLYHQRHV